ncbi:MAG: ATP-binding protein [Acidobacteriaceae bacterium]
MSGTDELFSGGGQMGAIMRAFDWSKSPLGPAAAWPQSLRTSVSICLNSAFAILVWWGPDLVMLYNDAYSSVIANKHPRALGSAGRQVFPEIWTTIGPMLEGVMQHGEAIRADDLLLFLERNGYPEECYFSFCYSPILDETGGVGGVFTPVQETTKHVIGERRLKTLTRSAQVHAEEAASPSHAAQMSAAALAGNLIDLPFVAIYLFEESGAAHRHAHSGDLREELAPEQIEANAEWLPLTSLRRGKTVVEEASARGTREVPRGHWGDPVTEIVALPLKQPGSETAKGFMLVGVNPRKRLDAAYRDFLNLVADNVATAITDAEAIQQERSRLKALAELDRAKTAFFSNISHEFRTPLSLIMGPLQEAVLDPALPAQTRENLEVAQRNSLRLQKLVNNLLEFSRIEAGKAHATFECLDLAKFTEELASGFQSTFHKADLSLKVAVSQIRAPVCVDREMWEKIVLNLLSNAFKFTFTGGVTVELTEVEGSVQLTVADTGIGVPAVQLPKLFQRFERVEGAKSRSYEGTGIGLALVQELVTLHEGSVEVDSEENVGTRFTVRIPTGTAHLSQEQVGCRREMSSAATRLEVFVSEAMSWVPGLENREAAGALDIVDTERLLVRPDQLATRKRVLVADDNADMRHYVTRLLEGHYDIEAVANGRQAIASMDRQHFDLLLSDVMMPEMDGLALLAAVRGNPETASLPVILVSARAGEDSEIEGLQRGADGYLVKPFSARELIARVSSVLKIADVRTASEQALRAERARLLDLFRQAPAFMTVLRGPEHVFEMANPLYKDLIGDRAIPGKPLREAIPEAEAQGYLALLDRVYETGAPFVAYDNAIDIARVAGQPPERRYLDFVYQPLREPSGTISGILVLGVDVTARRETEQALRQSEILARNQAEQLEAALAASATGTYRWDARGDEFLAFDDNLKRLVGKLPGTPFRVAEDFLCTLHPEDLPAVLAALDVSRRGADFSMEYRVIWDDGSIHWIYDRAKMIWEEGKPSYLVGACTDITWRKEAEEALREQRERFNFATNASLIGYWFCDLPFDKLNWDYRVKEHFWLPQDTEVTIGTFYECIHPEDRERTRHAIEKSIAKNKRYDIEFRTVTADGKQKWIHSVGRTAYDEAGAPIRFDGITQDITLQKQSDQALRKSEKLAVVGRMAASISHEINNPLESVTNLLYLIREQAGTETLRNYALQAEEELARVSHIVTQTLQFNRQPSGPSKEKLSTLLDSSVAIYQGRFKQSDLQLVRDYKDSLRLACFGSEIRQVFSNLIGNAFDASKKGGKIILRTRDSVDWQTGRRGIRVVIADTGAGMDQRTLERIFEPFFTTKGINGTGLGLWVSADILKRHQAFIRVKSRQIERTSGSVFPVFFPLISAAVPIPDEPSAAATNEV